MLVDLVSGALLVKMVLTAGGLWNVAPQAEGGGEEAPEGGGLAEAELLQAGHGRLSSPHGGGWEGAGTGIGLALTRELVHFLKGEIAVESEPARAPPLPSRYPLPETRRPGMTTAGRISGRRFLLTFLRRRLYFKRSMSRALLYKKFKALTGQAVADFIRRVRLHKARQLLETTGLNISQAAMDVGFKNLSTFSRNFTGEFGMPPRQIKKQEENFKKKNT